MASVVSLPYSPLVSAKINNQTRSFFDPPATTAMASASARSYAGSRFVVSASKVPNEVVDSSLGSGSASGSDSDSGSGSGSADQFMSQDDVNFLVKLGVGSLATAAAIKYGSVVVPEITRPNITQALIMISTPVLAAVLILIRASRVEQ